MAADTRITCVTADAVPGREVSDVLDTVMGTAYFEHSNSGGLIPNPFNKGRPKPSSIVGTCKSAIEEMRMAARKMARMLSLVCGLIARWRAFQKPPSNRGIQPGLNTPPTARPSR